MSHMLPESQLFLDMQSSNPSTHSLVRLIALHVLFIAASNYLVQFPIQIFGLHTTWGAFSFPLIFLTTDLTVRICGAELARKVIFIAMFPALLLSYLISVLFLDGAYQGAGQLLVWNAFVARIAVASFAAYAIGQLCDVLVFNRLRQRRQWWLAPAASSVFGNAVDTVAFFAIAFYASSDAFMAANWTEIAAVDYAFKLLINILLFLPAYKVVLRRLQRRLESPA
ncbi:7-cyano-7-deazaguanine/7-aminomethyl-7-deazaguanine transporter [Coraliomargarita algicola]|uniref:Probable queuosine precursor transporter n=2 Tax=Coraliomargarita algicola TaxID=3092156 RepID=A0ABZ0RI85_9BACT|nr:7-cyano-7-deazaguanine/7-aminomethyl-7-deazaguanine transporter [Coraliomargarita sp. J2-16]WPJ95777.1 7-cyano-7-deazaguanine/7-aminomethyl-7-deazaguanine transporter [Coraliomargarita sp. J2-16]